MDSSGFGGSTVNDPPRRRRHQSADAPNVVKDTSEEDDNENEVVVQYMSPSKHHQSSYSSTATDDDKIDATNIAIQCISKEKDDEESSSTASKTITTWKKLHEITLLEGVLEYCKENNRTYPFYNTDDMHKLYKDWIEKGGVYVDEDAFNNKMVELPERYFMNQERVYRCKMIKGWKDPLEAKIFDLSHMIWGRDIDKDDDKGGPSAP